MENDMEKELKIYEKALKNENIYELDKKVYSENIEKKQEILKFIKENEIEEDEDNIFIYISRNNILNYCCESDFFDDYCCCENCFKIVDKSDANFCEDDGCYICDYCIDYDCNDYYRCEDCEEIHNNNYVEYFFTNDNRKICKNCRDENYFFCEDCGELYDFDDSCGNDDCICIDCYNARYKYIKNYHETKESKEYEPQKIKDEDNNNVFYGFELETEKEDDDINYFFENFNIEKYDNLIFAYEHDGSLTDTGIEIISHPMTFNYFLSKKEQVKEFLKLLIDNNFTSHNNGDCGLHFHISNLSENEKYKIFDFVEKHFDLFIKFSRRASTTWCNKFRDDKEFKSTKNQNKKEYYNSFKYSKSHNNWFIDTCTDNITSEIRVMRGTLNYKTFFATFDLIQALVRTSKDNNRITLANIYKKINDKNNFIEYINKRNIIEFNNIIKQNKKIENNNNNENEIEEV